MTGQWMAHCKGVRLVLLLMLSATLSVCYPGGGCGSDPDIDVFNASASPPLLPPWPPTYNMSLSTIIMPCNYTGLFDTSFSSRFGIVDYDWSNSKLQWANQKPMDPEAKA